MKLNLQNSAHFLECVEIVKAAHPNAEIKETKAGQLWQLVDGEVELSEEYNSHYACWYEARLAVEKK
jgi:hypothetical protein